MPFDALSRRHLLAVGGGLVLGPSVAPPAADQGATTADPTAGPTAAEPTGATTLDAAPAWQSTRVHYERKGRLVYAHDDERNRIPDFSHAGYHNADRALPDIPTVLTLRPVEGDNTAHIQAAIDTVGQRPKDANGHRGAVLLEAGTYTVAGTLRLRHDGVVLRGVGDDADPTANTVIRAVGNTPVHRDVLLVGGGGTTRWAGEVDGTRTLVTSDVVPVGARSFNVADARRLAVGDNLVLVHPCTAQWLAAVDGGGTATDAPWEVDSQPIVYNRRITDIRGNRVTVDVPLFNHLRRELSPSYVYVWDRAGLVTEVGVENLRIDIEYAGDPDQDEDHAWNAIKLRQVEDAWVRDCTVLHFAHGGVETQEATRVTVSRCRAFDPVSRVTGGLRYNFNTESHSQQILFVDCHARAARHAFISNGTSTTSGVVFLRGVSEGSLAASEGHRRWSQGLLYDNHRELDPSVEITLGLYNRGDYGTGHGWAAAHSVAWNADLAGRTLVVQRPPTAQNYAIGCAGVVTGDGPFDHPAGHIEGTNRPGLVPASLYDAQHADRARAATAT